MNFNNVLETKEYFQTLDEAKDFRPTLWSIINNKVEMIKEELFDEFSMEECIFIIDNFFDKNIYHLDEADIVIVAKNRYELEQLVESKFIEKYTHDAVRYYILEEDSKKLLFYYDHFYHDLGSANKINRIEKL